MQMPKVDFARLQGVLTQEELDLLTLCVVTKGDNKGCLKVQHTTKWQPSADGCYKVWDRQDGMAHYVWRMLTFNLCAYAPYVCMPMCAGWNLQRLPEDEEWMKTERETLRVLDLLVDKVLLYAFTPCEGNGVKRWGRAFGYL